MDRRVTGTKRDRQGKIVALCNKHADWSPRSTKDILKDIKQGLRSYYVQELPKRAYVRAVSRDTLQTTQDPASLNSLNKLPIF